MSGPPHRLRAEGLPPLLGDLRRHRGPRPARRQGEDLDDLRPPAQRPTRASTPSWPGSRHRSTTCERPSGPPPLGRPGPRGARRVPGFGRPLRRAAPASWPADAVRGHPGGARWPRARASRASRTCTRTSRRWPRTVAAIAARLAGVPFSVTTHAKDIFHEDVDPAAAARTPRRRAEHVVAISEYNRRHLRRRVPRARATGVRPRPQRPRPRRASPTPTPRRCGRPLQVVAVGRLVEKKGFDHLVEAVARCRRASGTAAARAGRIAGDGRAGAGRCARRSPSRRSRTSSSCVGPRTQAEVARAAALRGRLRGPVRGRRRRQRRRPAHRPARGDGHGRARASRRDVTGIPEVVRNAAPPPGSSSPPTTRRPARRARRGRRPGFAGWAPPGPPAPSSTRDYDSTGQAAALQALLPRRSRTGRSPTVRGPPHAARRRPRACRRPVADPEPAPAPARAADPVPDPSPSAKEPTADAPRLRLRRPRRPRVRHQGRLRPRPGDPARLARPRRRGPPLRHPASATTSPPTSPTSRSSTSRSRRPPRRRSRPRRARAARRAGARRTPPAGSRSGSSPTAPTRSTSATPCSRPPWPGSPARSASPGVLEVNAPLIDEQADPPRPRGRRRPPAPRSPRRSPPPSARPASPSRSPAGWSGRGRTGGPAGRVLRRPQRRRTRSASVRAATPPPRDRTVPPVVVFVGTLKPWHGVERPGRAPRWAAAAVAACASSATAPSGRPSSELAASLGVDVEFTGAVAPPRCPRPLAECAVAVAPYPPRRTPRTSTSRR